MLFLLTIGFFAGIPVMLLLIIQDVNILFLAGRWTELTTSGASGYHSFLAPLLIFKLFGGILILIYMSVRLRIE